MKVFIVDDSAIVLEKLTAMISGIDGVEVAGQAMNANDAIQSIVKLKPDVAILDIRMNGGGNGMDVLKRIKKGNPAAHRHHAHELSLSPVSGKVSGPGRRLLFRQGDGNREDLRYVQTIAGG